jgi:serine-type D-Ala-D-Ala carboxypeptidase (penicillin-binding protein 5/6)
MFCSFKLHVYFLFLAIFSVISCGGNPDNQSISTKPRAGTIPATQPPPIFAQSAIVVDIKTGKVLFSKNADRQIPVASTQKIITALCVLESGDIDKPLTVDSSDGQCEPTKLEIKAGEVYSRRDLLRVLMVKSANDVARALARDVGGTHENFSIMMNQECKKLGMKNSHFCNPHGLTETGQYSTARDMSIAARQAYRSPLLRSFISLRSTNFTFNSGKSVELQNTNRILKRLPYCNGMKTGTTNAAGRCLVCTGEIDDRSVVVVVLKSNNSNIWKDSETLMRWALER